MLAVKADDSVSMETQSVLSTAELPGHLLSTKLEYSGAFQDDPGVRLDTVALSILQ